LIGRIGLFWRAWVVPISSQDQRQRRFGDGGISRQQCLRRILNLGATRPCPRLSCKTFHNGTEVSVLAIAINHKAGVIDPYAHVVQRT
jgi:hypothetical protein